MNNTDSGHDENLAGQRSRLSSLAACEDRIRDLREQENDLEIEHIAAQAALSSAAGKGKQELDPVLAKRIGHALALRHELEHGLCSADEFPTTRGAGNSRQVDRLRAGCAALQAWLDASRPRKPGPVVAATKIMLLIVTIVTIWAAIAIHPAFLLMLVVFVGPASFAMGRGQDMEWHRVAARRRFATSGLADFTTWTDESVQTRLVELQSMLDACALERAQADGDDSQPEPVDTEALTRRIADNNRQLASDLAAAGLTGEDVIGDTGKRLRLLGAAERAQESLHRVKSERQRLHGEAVELRDQLQSYLHSRGVKPTEIEDTAAAISRRLDSLSNSS